MPRTTPVSTAAAAVPAAGGPVRSWGRAIEVPGLAALNKGGKGDVVSVSCGSAGNCAAGGYYTRHGRYQGFVVSEKNGRWGRAIEVPGLGALNAGAFSGGGAEVNSVSCGSAGNCAAVGSYLDQHRHSQGFVVSETNGRWGRAIEVPGLGALDTGSDGRPGAAVNSVSCGSAGTCAAGGFYQDQRRHSQGFVASENNGRWGRAIEVPGLGALNTGAVVAGAPRCCRCRAVRRATAGPAGTTAFDRWPAGCAGRRSWPANRTAAGGWRSRYRGWRR